MVCTQVVACVCLAEKCSKPFCVLLQRVTYMCRTQPRLQFETSVAILSCLDACIGKKITIIHSWLTTAIVTAIYTRFSQQNQYNTVAIGLIHVLNQFPTFHFLITQNSIWEPVQSTMVNQISQLFCKIVLMFMHLLHWELDNKVCSIVIVLMGSLLAVDTLAIYIHAHICIHFGT